MTSTCSRFEAVWDEYRDGAASAAEAEAFERHMASCEACRRLWAEESAVLDELGEPAIGGDAVFVERIVERWTVRPVGRGVLARLSRLAAIAAAVLVIASVGIELARRSGSAPQTAVVAQAEDPVSVLFEDVTRRVDAQPEAMRSAISQTTDMLDIQKLVELVNRPTGG